MNRVPRVLVPLATAAILFSLFSRAALLAADTPSLQFSYKRFGEVTVYPTEKSRHLVLFISGDGGWNRGVVDMAKSLAGLDATVVGINIRRYERAIAAADDECTDAVSDYTGLAKAVEEKLGLTHQTPPILVGYSSGATLAYATLVQAKPHTFGGALTLGFCPDLDLKKPMCKGHGLTFTTLPKGKGYVFDASETLEDPFIVFQGDSDKVCDPEKTAAYTKKVRKAELVWLPSVGHGFSVERRWLPQFKDAFARLAGAGK